MICLNADCIVVFIKNFRKLENNGNVVFLKPNPHTLYIYNNILLSRRDQRGRLLFYAIKKKNQKNKSKLITWNVKTEFRFKQSYFLFRGNALKNESIKAALFYEKQHVELAAGFSNERAEEPKVDRCFKQLNSCCFFILETYW